MSINNDRGRERDELFKVALSSATGDATIVSAQSEATILIDDDDPWPKVTVTASVAGLTSTGAPGATPTTPEGRLSVAEGDSGSTEITFTITLEGTSYERANFNVGRATALGTATVGEDFTSSHTNFTSEEGLPVGLNIPAGSITTSFTLSVVGDETYELDETLYFTFSYVPGGGDRGVITNSADRAFLVELTIANDEAREATPASNLQARPAGSGKLAVTWDPAFLAPNGYSVRWREATADTTLSAVNTVTATSFTITGLEDDTGYIVRLDTRNLADDGVASGTNLSVEATTTSGAAPTVTAIANQTAGVGEPIEVDVDATPGTEGDSLKYQATSSAPAVATVTPTALTTHGASSKVRVTPVSLGTATITVTVSDGTEVGTETFDVQVVRTLSIAPVAGNGVTVRASTPQRGEIDEDHASGAVTLEVTLFPASTETVTVSYATALFDSSDAAVSSASIDPATGADFTEVDPAEDLTFMPGDTRKTVSVSITDDANHERSELFGVALVGTPTGAVLSSTRREATILITDSDRRPRVTLSGPSLTTGVPYLSFVAFEPNYLLSVPEGDSGTTDATLTFMLEGTSTEAYEFLVQREVFGNNLGNTATRDVDYTDFAESNPQFTIAPGQTTGTFTLPIIGDTTDEDDEVIGLFFTAIGSFQHFDIGYFVGRDTISNELIVHLTITDDDGKPAAPAAPTLEARSGRLGVSWAAPTDDGGSAVTDYDVRYRTSPSGTWQEWNPSGTSTALTASITGLANGTAYDVQVRAQNKNGAGEWSATATETPVRSGARFNPGTRVLTILDVPISSELSGSTHGNSSYDIRIEGPLGSGPGALTVTIGTTETVYDSKSCSTTGTKSCTWRGDRDTLAQTDSATFSVRLGSNHGITAGISLGKVAFFPDTEGETTAASSIPVSIVHTVPGAPQGLAMALRPTTATLTWSDPDDASLTKYQYRIGTDGTWTDVPGSGATTTRYDVVGALTAGTSQTVFLRAVNPAGESPAASVATMVPAAPSGLAAVPLSQSARLDWSDPDDASLIKYQYRIDTGGTWTDVPGSSATTTSYTVTGLTTGVTYTLFLRAVNFAGAGPDASAAVQDTAPGFGSETIADQTWTVGVEVDLVLPAATGGNGTLGYALSPALPAGLAFDAATRTIGGAAEAVASTATIYTYTVADEDANTASTDSASLTFDVTILGPGPEGLDGEDGVVAGSGQVTLRWEAPKGAGPFGYAVRYRKAGTQEAHTLVTGLSATTYTVTGLENGAAYAFQVRSETGGEPSGWAPERPVTATPVAVPANLEADSGDRQVTLEWEAASGADAYEVRWRPAAETGWSSGAVVETTALSQVVTGLTNAVAYGFQVRAKNATGASAWGPEPALRASPARPVGVVAVAAPEVGRRGAVPELGSGGWCGELRGALPRVGDDDGA